mgnify:CR=1 FL=1
MMSANWLHRSGPAPGGCLRRPVMEKLKAMQARSVKAFFEFISELSGNATKELAIELALVAIKETWTGLNMDMVPFKDDRPDVFKVSAFPTHHVPPLRLRILVPAGAITSAHTRPPA